MNLNYLKTFITTVEQKGLSRAARVLNLTQPAVTKHINILEDYCGCKLLDRSGGNLKLTDSGRIFYQNARKILNLMDDSLEKINKLNEKVRGHLVIEASTVPGHYVLPRLIGPFKKHYPLVQVSVGISNSGKAVEKVMEGDAHLGVVGREFKLPNITSVKLDDDELVLVVPSHHRLAAKKSISPQEIEGEELVWREADSGTRRTIEQKLSDAGISKENLNIVAELGSTEAIINAVEAGVGISLVSKWATRDKDRSGRLKSLSLENVSLKRNLYVVYSRHRTLSAAAEAFLKFCIAGQV